MEDKAPDLDFTEHEVYCALRLQIPDTEARSQASDFAQAYSRGMDWATSDAMLLYLAVGSKSGRARVERIRRSMVFQLCEDWMMRERQRNEAASEEELADAWIQHVEATRREWDARIAALTRELRHQGLLPGDPEGE